jgi:hypothetical protein
MLKSMWTSLLLVVQRGSDFAGGVLLLSRGSERKRRADPSGAVVNVLPASPGRDQPGTRIEDHAARR